MLRNGEDDRSGSLADGLDRLRRRMAPAFGGEPGGSRAARELINELAAGAGSRPTAARFLDRLALLMEVWDCLPERGGERGSLAALCDGAIVRFRDQIRERSEGVEAESWFLRASEASWGRYLALLEDAPDEAAEPDPAPDLGRILDLLLTRRAPSGEARPPSVPEPAPPRMAREVAGPAPAAVVDPPEEPPSPELLDAFRIDAEELMERLVALAFEFGEPGPRAELLHDLGRGLHTLKGAAGAVGYGDLVVRVHELEGHCEGMLARPEIGSLDPLRDELRELLSALEGVLMRPEGPADPVDAAGADPADPGPPAAPIAEEAPERGTDHGGMLRIPRRRVDELLDLVAELTLLNGPRGSSAEKIKGLAAAARSSRNRLLVSIDHLCELSPGLASLSPSAAPTARGGEGPLAEVMEIVQNLSEQADDLALLAESARSAADPLADESHATNRLTRQLWEVAHSVRVAPIRPLFRRLVGVAENAAGVEGRRVEVDFRGEEAELDRALQDRIFEPLLHLVRNAVAHGIEMPEERALAGKAATGRITLEAVRGDLSLTVTVRDDGRGLDYAAIEAKGRQAGLIELNERPGVDRLQAILFRPGFSTAASAGPVSGRGIGMDVVARDVARLSGTVRLSSTPGRGTAVSISLPARLSLEELLIVRVDGQAFALPLGSVELAGGRDEPTGRGGREAVVLHAREALGFPPLEPPSRPTEVRIRLGGEVRSMMIDEVEGARKLVVKPLSPLLGGHPAVSGTILSAEGELVLLLDPVGLVRLAEAGARPSSAAPAASGAARSGRVLLVDDSVSVRRTISRHLRAMGLEVDEAFDGIEALRLLRERAFGLILTDLQMPRMDGFGLLDELRRWGYPAPVVVASTRSDPETRRRVAALGARDFVAKPARFEDLAGAIGPLLGLAPEARPAG